MIAAVRDAGARVAVDTSGQPLKEIVRLGGIWLIKPNITELRELLNKHVADSPSATVKAAKGLCDKVRIVVVSRGAKGAIAVTADSALQAKASTSPAKARGTVGCGDYLLAGLLAGLTRRRDLRLALAKGIKVATARACGLTERMNWAEAESKIGADVSTL
jgi:fructose-1-phosphate kinase PfkB-like protein